MDRLEQIVADFKALLSKSGMLQFLAEETGLPPETMERIYALGEPWPIVKSHYHAWLEDYEDVGEALLALGPIVAMDTEEQIAKLERREETEIPQEFVEQLERVHTLSGEDLDTITAVYQALFSYYQQLSDLQAAFTIVRMKREGGLS